MRWMGGLLILIGSIFLSACSFLSPIKNGSETKYIINEVDQPIVRHRSKKITLLVTPMQADPLYATKQMAYTVKPYRIDYYARNRWASMPSQMLQNVLINTLRCTNYFFAVDAGPSTAHYDFVLNTRLQELRQIVLCPCSILKLIIYVQIVNTNTNKIIASRQFMVIEPLQQVSPCGEALASNIAAACIAKKIANFSIRRIR